MHTIRRLSVLLCLTALAAFIGGCAFGPWNEVPITPFPENLIENSKAGDPTGWYFSSADAFIHGGTPDPAFGIRNHGFIRQTVDVREIPGEYAVLMAFTATETIAPTGMGQMRGAFLDIEHPQLVIGDMLTIGLVSQSVTPLEWVVIADYFLMPTGTGEIEVYLENTFDMVTPPDGTITWFDDVELWIVETEQEAQDLIAGYRADHP